MVEDQVFDAPNAEQITDDFILSPQGNTGGKASDVEVKMSAVVYDRPHDEFKLPSGKVLYIYSKPEGQLREIDIAFQNWMDAERQGEKTLTKKWRFWNGRKVKVTDTLTEIQYAKFLFFRAVFEDTYNPAKHQELTADEFMSMPLDLQTAIMASHRAANDPTDLLSAILGRDVSEGKKKLMPQHNG